jgi:DNA-directed RNA polymerase specialized sigma24 family protein
MKTHAMKEHFLKAYDAHIDDVFEYYFRETSHREVAKYLTRNTFLEVWDTIVHYGFDSLRNIKGLINRISKDQMRNVTNGKQSEITYRDNLWNLTLSQ